MSGQTDDALTRRAILLLIEAVRALPSDTGKALALLADAEAVAQRIDAPRGVAKKAADDADLG